LTANASRADALAVGEVLVVGEEIVMGLHWYTTGSVGGGGLKYMDGRGEDRGMKTGLESRWIEPMV
jgi:hypothetical protein